MYNECKCGKRIPDETTMCQRCKNENKSNTVEREDVYYQKKSPKILNNKYYRK